MTDRLKGCTVAFEHDLRPEDADHIMAAIRCLRGVAAVGPVVADFNDYIAEQRIKRELYGKMLDQIYPDRVKGGRR